MTSQELEKAVQLLNENYQGEIMKPYNFPIKEFVAAPMYVDKFTNYHIAYIQTLGNAARALSVVKDEDLMIYAVFEGGSFPNYNSQQYIFKTIQDFFADNEIKAEDLLKTLEGN